MIKWLWKRDGYFNGLKCNVVNWTIKKEKLRPQGWFVKLGDANCYFAEPTVSRLVNDEWQSNTR